MMLHRCRGPEDFRALMNGPEFTVRWMLEVHLARRHAGRDGLELPGFCTTCNRTVDFEANFDGAWRSPEGIEIPNWRETLRCPGCHFGGRERRMVQLITEWAMNLENRDGIRGYMTEQVTPLFRWANEALPWVEWIGSEYLDPGFEGGSVHDGLRHEDAEHLSFADDEFDVIVSGDVLEHVADPARMLSELARVTRPGGTVLLTFPMDPQLDRNRARAARRADGSVEFLLEPILHGNPVSGDGSLVFTDFGWEVLEQMRAAGLEDPTLDVYWSYEHGWLGTQFTFAARRPAPAGGLLRRAMTRLKDSGRSLPDRQRELRRR